MVAFLIVYIIAVIIDYDSLKKVNSKKDIIAYVIFTILVIAIAFIYIFTENHYDLVHNLLKIID